MNFFALFQKKSKLFFVYLGILGIINSVWASALLLLINNKITNTPLPFFDQYDWIIYIGLIIVSFGISLYVQSYMIKLTYNLGNDINLSLFNKLRFASYEDYLKLTEEKVRTAGSDARVLQKFPQIFLESFNALIMVIIGIGYLFWIDKMGAALVFGVMFVLAFIYIYRNEKIEEDQNEVRDLANTYMQSVNDYLRGFRELKMNTKRSDNLFKNYLAKNRNQATEITIRYLNRALGNELIGSYAWYLMIGLVLFVLPYVFNMDQAVKTNFLVTLLYLMGPVTSVIGAMNEFISIGVAMDRVKRFEDAVDSKVDEQKMNAEDAVVKAPFSNIKFEQVTYEYYDKKKATTFKLKPLDIEIQKGESIFITGGNGSGKSTFINLLSGLYKPKTGTIYFNDQAITDENDDFYRNQLSCIFTDNYLFTENYDKLDLSPDNERFMNLLKVMKLEGVVTFDQDSNKVLHTLSKGQQKRMALIYSILEDKEIFIFDEWAAEQDPVFRKYFYETIVPELKNMGKTVVAVTHDDTYFHLAERFIKFDYGKIVKDEFVKTPILMNAETSLS